MSGKPAAGRWSWLPLAGVGLLGLGMRLAALRSLLATPYGTHLIIDERLYHEWASRIAAGLPTAAVFEFPPLPAWLFAAVYRVIEADPVWIRGLNVALGTVTCLLVSGIGRRLGGRTAGLLAGAGAAVYAPFILASVVPHKTALDIALFGLTAWLLLQERERSRPARLLLLGVTMGLLLNVRGNFVSVVPAAALALFCGWGRAGAPVARRGARLALVAAGLMLAVAPFAVRAMTATGSPQFLAAQGGMNLYLGNNRSNPTPYYRPVAFASPSPYEQGAHFAIEAGRRAGRELSAREASWYWAGEVAHEAWQRPGEAAGRFGLKLLALINRFESGDHYGVDFIGRQVPFFGLPLLHAALALPLGLAGLLLGLRRRTAAHAAVGWLVAGYGLFLCLFFITDRYRLPLLTVLLPCAAGAVVATADHLRRRPGLRSAAFGSVVTASVFGLAWLPLPGSGQNSQYHALHAGVLARAGDIDGALAHWRAAADSGEPAADFARVALASHLLARGGTEAALELAQQVPELSFAAANRYELEGSALLRLGRDAEARAAWERSLAINAGQLRVIRKLAGLLESTDPAAAAARRADLARAERQHRPF